MGQVVLQTPIEISARDYDEIQSILYNINEKLICEPKVALFTDIKGNTEWVSARTWRDGQYHAILYIPGKDDDAAKKIWMTYQCCYYCDTCGLEQAIDTNKFALIKTCDCEE